MDSSSQDALVRARIGHASMALGRAIGAIEIAATYCNDRSVFGERLGAKQGVQWMLADLATQIEASRALVFNAAAAYDRGAPDAAMMASMAKLHATDLCMRRRRSAEIQGRERPRELNHRAAKAGHLPLPATAPPTVLRRKASAPASAGSRDALVAQHRVRPHRVRRP
jgi:alkylation response protein AidB-like acyl-CoA dehydrogenase